MFLKQLFQAADNLCKLLSVKCQISQPYSNAGKQYAFIHVNKQCRT